MSTLICVVLIDAPDDFPAIVSFGPDFEANTFDEYRLSSSDDLTARIAELRPHAILSFGDYLALIALHALPLNLRNKWVHMPDAIDQGLTPENMAAMVESVFTNSLTIDRFPEEPLVSVCTPVYLTGPSGLDQLRLTYQSLCDQSYGNWEWVLWDDSPNDKMLSRWVKSLGDPRVTYGRGLGNSGRIGEVKRRAFGMARGSILVELDHDDELTNHCLADVVEAFGLHPDAGFAFTDCAEIIVDHANRFVDHGVYPDGWGMGQGSYRVEGYWGLEPGTGRSKDFVRVPREFMVTNYPDPNVMTMTHIVGVPNHVRAWRAATYWELGGHNAEIHVADDYEVLIRTYLATPMVHIRRFGYIQRLRQDQSNTQRTRNKEIQRLTRLFSNRYGFEIAESGMELRQYELVERAPFLGNDDEAVVDAVLVDDVDGG